MADRLTFAEWQQSRGITPWTTVHGWKGLVRVFDDLAVALNRLGVAALESFRPLAAFLRGENPNG